jgi:hypothetical protein
MLYHFLMTFPLGFTGVLTACQYIILLIFLKGFGGVLILHVVSLISFSHMGF